MAIRGIGAGEVFTGLVITEAKPCSTYRAVGPDVGDYVRTYVSGAADLCVNTCAAGESMLKTCPYPVGIVREVNNDSTVVTVQWLNVYGVVNLPYSGTATRGLALQHCNAAQSIKFSCIATAATTPKPWVVAVDVPTTNYLQAFIL